MYTERPGSRRKREENARPRRNLGLHISSARTFEYMTGDQAHRKRQLVRVCVCQRGKNRFHTQDPLPISPPRNATTPEKKTEQTTGAIRSEEKLGLPSEEKKHQKPILLSLKNTTPTTKKDREQESFWISSNFFFVAFLNSVIFSDLGNRLR